MDDAAFVTYVTGQLNAKRRDQGLSEITEDQAREAFRIIEQLASAFENQDDASGGTVK